MNARTGFDTLAPEFSLRINGTPLPSEAAADLMDVTVLEDVDAMSMFTFSLTCYDAAQMKVKWVDDALFREGNPVEIEMGYRDNKATVFSGEITGLEPTFAEAGSPTLVVRGYDRRHRLMRERKTRSYLNVKDSDIASQLAGTAGLKPQVEDSKVTLPYLLQHNQTDLEFMLTRARRIGFEVVVNDRTLIYRPRRIEGSPVLTLRREIELLDFRPRMSTLDQVEGLQVKGWNAKDKKEIVGRAGSGDVTNLMAGKASGVASVRELFGASGSASVMSAVQTQDDADAVARQRFGEMALGYIRGEGRCIGDPRLRAGMIVQIDGLGERFSGHYYVTSTEQRFSISKGYRTCFTAKRNAT